MINVKIKGNLLKEYLEARNKLADKVIDKSLSALKEETPVDTGKARDGWVRKGNTIENPVEYISHLNEGSSQQAPKYFIEKTLLAQKGVVPRGTIVRSL